MDAQKKTRKLKQNNKSTSNGKSKPRCSVIVPMYNAEKYIVDTLNGIQSQTISDIEIIVVDDCSKDKSLSLVKKIQKDDKRIKIINNKTNCRVAETRNNGIRAAKSDWIAFCDADDIWHSNKLEKQFEIIKSKNARLCFTSIQFIDDDGKLIDRNFIIPEKVSYKDMLKQNRITLSSAVLEKELCVKHPMHNAELHEDYIFWLEILKNEVDFAYGLKDILVDYRFTIGSKSRNKLKSAKMTYKTYRFVGLNFFKAHFYLTCYFLRSLKKYGKSVFKQKGKKN